MRTRLIGAACALACLTSVANAGPLVVAGTGDGMEMLQALGTAYTADTPDTLVVVPPSVHSSGGIAALLSKETTLARIARPLTAAEENKGIMSVPVVRLPSAIFVHPAVKVRNVTAAQLVGLFEGRITNWRDLGGEDLRVRVIRREDGDSMLTVLRTTMPGWGGLQFSEKARTARTTQEMLDFVQEFEGAIAFGPYTRALEAHIGVMRVGGLHPADSAYPSSVTLRLAFRISDVSPDAISFIRFARSEKAQRLFTTLGGLPVVLPDLSPGQ